MGGGDSLGTVPPCWVPSPAKCSRDGVLQHQLQAAFTPWDTDCTKAGVLWPALVEPCGDSGCWGTLRLLGRLAQASCPWRGGANPREIRARGDV